MKRLIYTTQTHRPTKYKRFYNEYYQNGDTIERYTTSSEKVPGRLESGESRRSEGRLQTAVWQINDPNMPQWLKKYINYETEPITEESIAKLKSEGYRVYTSEDNPLIIFRGRSIKVLVDEIWVDLIPLIKMYYNKKNTTDRLLKKFEEEWFNHTISYQKLLDREAELEAQKEKEKYDYHYQNFFDRYNPATAYGDLEMVLSSLVSNEKGSRKEYYASLLEKVKTTEVTREEYANIMVTTLLKLINKELI